MARLSYHRNACLGVWQTTSGPRSCEKGALRGKAYCRTHAQAVRISHEGRYDGLKTEADGSDAYCRSLGV